VAHFDLFALLVCSKYFNMLENWLEYKHHKERKGSDYKMSSLVYVKTRKRFFIAHDNGV